MYKCKQLIIFPVTICLQTVWSHSNYSYTCPCIKTPCCVIILVDEIAVQLPNFAVVFVACRVPAHSEPRTVHRYTGLYLLLPLTLPLKKKGKDQILLRFGLCCDSVAGGLSHILMTVMYKQMLNVVHDVLAQVCPTISYIFCLNLVYINSLVLIVSSIFFFHPSFWLAEWEYLRRS